MVNYKRIVCEVALLASLAALAATAPAADCAERHYDQRQNGTENYRLNIDGVVIAVAPVESLLAAASDINFSDLLDMDDLNELQQKPKPPVHEQQPHEDKPQEVKPDDAFPEALPKPGEPAPAAAAAAAPVHELVSKSGLKTEKKEASKRKHEKAQRLKLRLANILLPLLRRNYH